MYVRECPICGSKFEITSSRQNAKKFCSKECARVSYNNAIKRYWGNKKDKKNVCVTQVEVKIDFPDWVVKNKGR